MSFMSGLAASTAAKRPGGARRKSNRLRRRPGRPGERIENDERFVWIAVHFSKAGSATELGAGASGRGRHTLSPDSSKVLIQHRGGRGIAGRLGSEVPSGCPPRRRWGRCRGYRSSRWSAGEELKHGCDDRSITLPTGSSRRGPVRPASFGTSTSGPDRKARRHRVPPRKLCAVGRGNLQPGISNRRRPGSRSTLHLGRRQEVHEDQSAYRPGNQPCRGWFLPGQVESQPRMPGWAL